MIIECKNKKYTFPAMNIGDSKRENSTLTDKQIANIKDTVFDQLEEEIEDYISWSVIGGNVLIIIGWFFNILRNNLHTHQK